MPDLEKTREQIAAGLRAMFEKGRRMPSAIGAEELASELKKVYCEATGLPESQVKVVVDPLNGIVRVGEYPNQPQRYTVWEGEA